MAGLAFEHLAINVADPVAVAAWYVEHLGMEVVRRGDAPVHMHFLADAARRAMIEIYCNASAPTDLYKDLHPAQLHLAFTSADPDADTARLLTLQTAFGAAKMALESVESPAILRARVTSPGGTTERALAILRDGGVETLLAKALEAARQRAHELGDLLGRQP